MDYYNNLVSEGKYDIQIEENKYIWNLANEDWVTRADSKYTIGCIHTTQGYDLNYVGVIFGKEIDYDKDKKSIVIRLDSFKDGKVKQNTDPKTVEELIINTYTTMLTRGIKGCFVYACNSNMKEYLKEYIALANEITIKD